MASIAIAIRRRKAARTRRLDVAVPKGGLVVRSIQGVAMLAGLFLYRLAPETESGWARFLFCLLYFPGVVGMTIVVSKFLEKRAIAVVGRLGPGAVPNNALERTREG
jgi:hypothetical protein